MASDQPPSSETLTEEQMCILILQAENKALHDELDRLQAEVAALREERDRLRAALQRIAGEPQSGQVVPQRMHNLREEARRALDGGLAEK
jgi:cell division septum initiation protein DivIVA